MDTAGGQKALADEINGAVGQAPRAIFDAIMLRQKDDRDTRVLRLLLEPVLQLEP